MKLARVAIVSGVTAVLASAGCMTIVGIHDFSTEVVDASLGDDASWVPTDGAQGSMPDVVDSGVGGDDSASPSNCSAGGPCSPGACQTGTWACTDAGAACTVTGSVEAGTICTGAGTDAGTSVCSGGVCTACNAGADCSDPDAGSCERKTIDCSSGSPVCTSSGANLPAGSGCGNGMYCYGAVCSTCMQGAACSPSAAGQNPCMQGKTTCNGGVAACNQLTTPASAGTSCQTAGGASGVCDGQGTCVACSAHAACTPNGNRCLSGTESCTGGYACNPGAAINDGKPCGTTGEICSSGSCGPCNASSCPNGCCDGNGCVAGTAQSVGECGTGAAGAACRACSVSNGTAACANDNCTVSSCASGYGDCDGIPSNGCETNLSTSTANCGTCKNACPVSCSGGSCIKVVGLAGGGGHTCALLSNGTVQCWGTNHDGALGATTTATCNGDPCSTTPLPVSGLLGNATSIAAGVYFTCALVTGGTVQCWGANDSGQLGRSSSTASSATPVTISLSGAAVAIGASSNFACAILTNGTVECWGSINSPSSTEYVPTQVTGLTSTGVAVAAGYSHACALVANGNVQCWGWSNSYGELGVPLSTTSSSSAVATSVYNATAVVAGGKSASIEFNCALISGGTVQCWGNGTSGELGTGATFDAGTPTPQTVAGITTNNPAQGLTASDGFACAVLSDGTVQCWGIDTYSQLGPAAVSTCGTSNYACAKAPVTVTGLSKAVGVAAGGVHACALLASGGVMCWGYNGYGELGNGTTTDSAKPVLVTWP